MYLVLSLTTLLLLSAALSTWRGYMILAAERGASLDLSPATLAVFARETIARTLLIVGRPLAWFPVDRHLTPPSAQQRGVVLLVPGGAGEYGILYFLERFLAQRGWQTARFAPQSWKSRLEDQARNLARAVEHTCQTTQSEHIRLVAFGRGGLLASWYTQHLEGATRIQRLVTIGTAWSGSRMAVFRNATARRDLQLDNPRLDGLSPPNVSTVCIWSAEDPEVIPPESAVIDHGTDPIAIGNAGHYEMLISARVYRTVDMALQRQGKPPAIPREAPA